MNNAPATGTSETRRRRWCAATILLFGGLLLAWTGCSPQKNYKVLSFFFDGVPDPNAPKVATDSSEEGATGQPVVKAAIISTHKPFVDGKCSSCHQAGSNNFDMGSLSTDSCMQCHEKVPREHALMHGPVAVKSCLWCHSPHESDHRALMRGPSAEVCGQCHEPGLLGPNPPEHKTGKSNCLDCHSGHGGNAKFFLIRQVASTTRPAAPPDDTPAPRPAEGGDR